MALIEVNHAVIRNVAAAILTYCSTQDSEMRIADGEIKSMLSNGWLGEDAREFGKKWEGVDADDSVTIQFRKSLEGFSSRLDACANEYQSAQEDVYEEANRLPKHLYW